MAKLEDPSELDKTRDVIELEDTSRNNDDTKKSDIVDEDAPRSAFAAWERGPLIRRFWRLYLTGLLVASGGM